MQTETKIWSESKSTTIATVNGPLMPPVDAKVTLKGRRYVVTEPPELYIEQAANPGDDDKTTIIITVKEG